MLVSWVKCIKCNAFKSPTGTRNYDRDSHVCNLKKMKRRVIYDFCSGMLCQKYFNIHLSHKLVCVAVKYLRLQQQNNRKPAVNQSYCATLFPARAGHWHNYSSLRCPWTKSNKITAKTFFLRVISLCMVKLLRNSSPWKHFTITFHINISYICLRKSQFCHIYF